MRTKDTPLSDAGSGLPGNRLKSDTEKIRRIDTSLQAISLRIDQAYNRICMDLPEINMEIFRTFQQASNTLESLGAHEPPGRIELVIGGIEHILRDLIHLIQHLSRQDAHILEHLRLSVQSAELAETQSSSQEILAGLPEFTRLRDELSAVMKEIVALEEELIRSVASHIDHDLASLSYTLHSAVAILNDLISRSGAMKEPIQDIMSGLQAHDIVNQDINTISLGLKKMQSKTNAGTNRDEAAVDIIFKQKACALSRTLISQLLNVIHEHGSALEEGILHIEEMVTYVKEDKDAIAEFLLMNKDGISTFGIVISEVSQMFMDIAGNLDSLSLLKESQQKLSSLILASSRGLERTAGSGPLSADPQGAPVLEIISLLNTEPGLMGHDKGAARLKEKSLDMMKESQETRRSLYDIKGLLIGSIMGIDTYSGRCLKSIAKFREDIQELKTTLQGSENLLEDLSDISLALQQTMSDEQLDQGEALPKELNDILTRLEYPHSNSLAVQNPQETDDGLTFF